MSDVQMTSSAGVIAGGRAEPSDVITPYEPHLAYPEGFPLQLDVRYEQRQNRWLPLVKLFLLLPHFVVAIVLDVFLFAAWFASIVAVLVTGRYPVSLFRFIVGAGRWLARVGAYLYLLTDEYPPFTLYEKPGGAVQATMDYPPGGRVARWRPLAAWVLVLPQYLLLLLRYVAMYLLLLGGFCSILFTGMLPRPLFDFIVQTLRMHCRLNAYTVFMTEKYPALRA